MMIRTLTVLLASAAMLSACQDEAGGGGAGGGARDQIKVVGSSTLYPFTTAVAEQFVNNNPGFKSPIVESTGTGAGMKLFCAGVGAAHPDIENASRRMTAAEYADCKANGVGEVIEIQVGIDGLAFAESNQGPKIALSPVEIYRALAANPYGKPNTAKTWRDVNPALPAIAIQVYGPPSTSGTRDSLNELIMQRGCDENPEMKALKDSDKDRHKDVCTRIREDGAYIDSGENDNLIVQKLTANPDAIGAFGYSFLEENQNVLHGISLSGVSPSYETISNFTYPGARPLYIYVKAAHLRAIPGLREFVAEYAKGWGPDGYLAKRGMIAASDEIRAANEKVATTLSPMDPSVLK
jgi:phosphate transport system substrate-binding protein